MTTRKSGLTSAIFFNHSEQAPQGAIGFNVISSPSPCCSGRTTGLPGGSLLTELARHRFTLQASTSSVCNESSDSGLGLLRDSTEEDEEEEVEEEEEYVVEDVEVDVEVDVEEGDEGVDVLAPSTNF